MKNWSKSQSLCVQAAKSRKMENVNRTSKEDRLASATVGKLDKIWRSCSISTKTKVKVYESLVIPVFLYGSECWNLRKREDSKILSTEMGWLRKILGVSRLQKVRNETVRNIQEETIINRIQKRIFTWFGHGSVN